MSNKAECTVGENLQPLSTADSTQLAEVSGSEAAQKLTRFFEIAGRTPELELEILLLEILGLYNKKHPQKSEIIKLLADSESAGAVLQTLKDSGTYPEEFISKLRMVGWHNLLEKRQRKMKLKKGWRVIQSSMKALALMGDPFIIDSNLGYLGSVFTTFAFWAVIDRIMADPEERSMVGAIALMVILRGLSTISADQVEFLTIIINLFPSGAETDQDIGEDEKSQAEVWEERINQLLKEGVLPQAILTVLQKRPLQSPLVKTVSTAEERVMSDLWERLQMLEKASGDSGASPVWGSEEDVLARCEARKKNILELLEAEYSDMPTINS